MQNPFNSFLSDKAYQFLIKNNLLREKGIRDFQIRKRFLELRREHATYLIIEMIQDEYARFKVVL